MSKTVPIDLKFLSTTLSLDFGGFSAFRMMFLLELM